MHKKNQDRKLFILLLFLSLFTFNQILSLTFIKKHVFSKNNNLIIKSFSNLFKINIKKNTILIFEPNTYHHECVPGYTKYFIDLGYNVDILIYFSGVESFCLFDNVNKIRLFTFNKLDEINSTSRKLSLIMKKYNYILVQTTNINKKDLYSNLNLFNINNSIFVFHDISLINKFYSQYLKENRIWTLGNFSKGLQVNPHFFYNTKIYPKNEKVRFFVTSSYKRNYTNLIESSYKLKKEKYNFEIIISGRTKIFNSNSIPKYLSDTYIFKHMIPYHELYEVIKSSDFIIIPFSPDNKLDILYKTILVTGSAQLVYGFLKPVLINREFADFYHFNEQNSLVYNNQNFYEIMKKAILLSNRDYIKLITNLHSVEKKIYETSINNIKKLLNKF